MVGATQDALRIPALPEEPAGGVLEDAAGGVPEDVAGGVPEDVADDDAWAELGSERDAS